jgi:3-phytase
MGCGGAPTGGPATDIPAVLETARVAGEGDAADDPAVWIAPDPSDSLVLGTDKTAGLYLYELSGEIADFLPTGRLNNVDVRYDFALPGPRRDIAVASDRTNIGLAVFLIDPEDRSFEA